MTARVRLVIVVLVTAALGACATAGASTKGAAISIDFVRSSCVQMPIADGGKVRFFVELVNRGGTIGRYASRISFAWLGVNGWTSRWPNAVRGGYLAVPAHSRKQLLLDFYADPAETIIGCGLKIGRTRLVHRIRVLR